MWNVVRSLMVNIPRVGLIKKAQCWYSKKESIEEESIEVVLNSQVNPFLGNFKLVKLTTLHKQNHINLLRDDVLSEFILRITIFLSKMMIEKCKSTRR